MSQALALELLTSNNYVSFLWASRLAGGVANPMNIGKYRLFSKVFPVAPLGKPDFTKSEQERFS